VGGLLGSAEENRLHQDRAAGGCNEPLGHEGASPDEELGAKGG
jgi:hypothetical protein